MLNWFWRSSSYPQSRAESPVLLYRTNTYLHMKVIKPLFCLEEGCVPFTAGTSSIFPSVILLLSCLLSSNVLSKSASQVSVFCKSSGLGVAQYPELFIVWFIFIYTSWSCAPSTCCTLTSATLFLKREAYAPLFPYSAFLQWSDLDSKSLDCVKIQLIIKIQGKYAWSSKSNFCISQCFPSNVILFLPFFSLWTPKNALS